MPTNNGSFPLQQGATVQRFFHSVNGEIVADTEDPPIYRTASTGNWSRTSTNTPNYFKITRGKPRGDLPMNAFTYGNSKLHGCSGQEGCRTTEMVGNPAVQSLIISEEVGYFVNSTGMLQAMDPNVLDDLSLKARSKLLSALKQQTINLGVAVGEGRQTVNLITNKAMQIAKAGLALRKFDFTGAARALGVPPRGKSLARSRRQTLAQNWLELQYGWKPLLSDIYGAAEFLAKQNNYQIRSRIRSSSSRPYKIVQLNDRPTDVITTTNSGTYTVTYVVYFSEPHGGSPQTALGLTNPLSVAWELVPFSFVVDWFLPLGDYFNNVDSTIGATFVKGCVTRFWRGQATQVHAGKTIVVGNRTDEFTTRKTFTGSGVSCSRSVLSDFPSNSFPRFKNPFSALHTANALALLAQVFSKSPANKQSSRPTSRRAEPEFKFPTRGFVP